MDYKLLKECIQKSDYGSIAALARAMEIQESNFNQMVNGKRNLTIVRLEGICEKIGIKPRLLFPK